MRNLVNFVLFQAGWFACVLGAAEGRPVLGAAAGLALVLLHLLFVARDRFVELRLVAVVTAGGCCVSAFNAAVGAVDFAPGVYEVAGVPLWIAALWALFATILRHSLGWLRGRYVLAAVAGLVGSPLSYTAAERLGAVEIHDGPLRGLLVLGLTWAIAVPACAFLASRP